MVKMLACHASYHGFKSHHSRVSRKNVIRGSKIKKNAYKYEQIFKL